MIESGVEKVADIDETDEEIESETDVNRERF